MRESSRLDMEVIRNTIESYLETFGEMPTVSEVSNATKLSRSKLVPVPHASRQRDFSGRVSDPSGLW